MPGFYDILTQTKVFKQKYNEKAIKNNDKTNEELLNIEI